MIEKLIDIKKLIDRSIHNEKNNYKSNRFMKMNELIDKNILDR